MRVPLRLGSSVLIFGLIWRVQCALAAEDSGRGVPDLGLSSFKALGALLLVLALIFLIAWLARRYLHLLPQNLARGNQIQVLSARPLGPKRSVHLLQVEGHRLLVGSSDSGVSLLKDFEGSTRDQQN